VRVPKGFRLSGVEAGIKKGRPDLALIVADEPADAAAVFTRNRFQAAPVVLSRRALARSQGKVRAVVVNAGCANAITGKAGDDAARRVVRRVAELVGCPGEQVFLASTGVIGVVLPDPLVRAALPDALASLTPGGLDAASRAILTTDVGPKVASATYTWHGRSGRITGFAKGAGMIHPDMATMLAFLMTDAPAPAPFLKEALREAADSSFNAISVDGDTSTNDTVLLLASGRLGGPAMKAGAAAASFREALGAVCRSLARLIVRDGEGAKRVMELSVTGARSVKEARLAAHAIGTSPLVKTALAGGDPNWGRILAAAGRSGARLSLRKVSLVVGGLPLVTDGAPTAYREADAARIFAKETVPVTVDLGVGTARATLLSCDLGHPYVSLNADYRS